MEKRHLHGPLMLPKHPQLLEEINNTIVDIKIHNDEQPMMVEKETLDDLRLKHKKHTLEEICDLLRRAYKAIDEQRENPKVYY